MHLTILFVLKRIAAQGELTFEGSGLLHFLLSVKVFVVSLRLVFSLERFLAQLAQILFHLLDVIGVVEIKVNAVLERIVELEAANAAIAHLDVGMDFLKVNAHFFQRWIAEVTLKALVHDFVHLQRLIQVLERHVILEVVLGDMQARVERANQ